MKKTLVLSILFLAVISCQKEDAIGVQKSSFPGETEEIGREEVKTIFNQQKCDVRLVLPAVNGKEGYMTAFSEINKLNQENTRCTAHVYFGTIDSKDKAIVPGGNISVIVEPDIKALDNLAKSVGYPYDFSCYEGCALIAISDCGGIYAIDEFRDGDILGTLNGLVRWMNLYAASQSPKQSVGGSDLPDAETLFKSFHGGYTFSFHMPNQEVGAVACSSKDYLSGDGTVDVVYSVLPLHAFDDQPGHGDYYVVNSTLAFNSASMYKGRFTKKHGGVHVRICGSYAREFAIKSYIADENGNPVGTYISDCMPSPTTVIGATSYSSGVSWSLNASVTGGVSSSDLYLVGSVDGGVSVSNTTERTISDLDIILDQTSGNVANYTYKFNNLPHYQSSSISISSPPEIAVHTSTFDHSYVIYLSDVKDYSEVAHRIKVEITKLNYGACRFYSTSADFDNFTWGLSKMDVKTIYKDGGFQMPVPNRIPTGEFKLTHDDVSFGAYVYDIKAISVDTGKEYSFTGSSYGQGDSCTGYLPVGKYNFVLTVGNSTSTTEVKSARQITIGRAATTNLNTGADFIK